MVNRLTGLVFGTLVAVVLAAAPATAGKVVISNWDGYMPKDMAEKFKAATGHDLEVAVHATNEEIMGKVTANNGEGFDVLFVSSPFAQALKALGIADTLDPAKIPNLKNLYPEAMQLKHDPGNTFSVPYAWGTTGLCYRSDLVKTAPTSWNDLLKPADDVKGKTTMLATDRWLLGAGFLAQGISVNETDPEKLEQTKNLLIEAKKTLLAFDDTTFYSKLVSGEAVMVQGWDGWCNYGIAENKDIKYVVPKEGSDLWVDTMVVVASSHDKDAAHAFINFVLEADNGKWVAENILYKVPNKAGMDALDKSMFETYPNLGMAPADLIKYEQLLDVGATQKDYTRLVTEITAAQ
ncbi:MAG: spermidine/putrescine ABC transporter substrate-binding protein [Hyphomicrobiaceae bacterium]